MRQRQKDASPDGAGQKDARQQLAAPFQQLFLRFGKRPVVEPAGSSSAERDSRRGSVRNNAAQIAIAGAAASETTQRPK
jgi:hypothetical protein